MIEGLAHLRFRNRQRRIREEIVPPHERKEPFLAEELAEGGHFWRGAVERRHRRARRAVSNQFDDAEQPDRTDRSHRWMALREVGEQFSHQRPSLFRPIDQAVFLIDRDGRQRGRAG